MSTLSIPPKNLMLLAVLGIGAYWFAIRSAHARNTGPQAATRGFLMSPARASTSPNAQPNLGAGLFSGFSTWLGSASAAGQGTAEINNTATPGQAGWGWNFYNDGTAISPEGVYYKNGQQVWSPNDGQAVNPVNSYSSQPDLAGYSNF